jgi:hypothetical protein
MIKNIPWQFETLPQTPFNTTEDILDDKGNPVGTIEVTTKGFTQLNEKRSLMGRKEAFVNKPISSLKIWMGRYLLRRHAIIV